MAGVRAGFLARTRVGRKMIIGVVGGSLLAASLVGVATPTSAQEPDGSTARRSAIEGEYVEPTLLSEKAKPTAVDYVDATAAVDRAAEPASPPAPEAGKVVKGSEAPVNEPDIVGGAPASVGEYPYFVSLQSSAAGLGDFFCGGSLLSTSRVVTAAHCVDQGVTPGQIQAVIGGTTLGAGDQGVAYNVSAINIHPSWDNVGNDFDVAVLSLATSVQRTDATTGGTRPEWLRLANGNEGSLVDPGDSSTVVGHGATSSGGPSSNALLEVAVPIQSDAQMTLFYGGSFDPATMVGAGPTGGGQDSCQGDSGGPLVISSVFPNIQIGDVSWGIGCAAPNFPGIYGELYQGLMRTFVNGLVTRPTNDNFPGPALPGNAGATFSHNIDAISQAGEPGGAGTADTTVWFSWTPSESGNAQVTVNSTTMDSIVSVYTGNVVNGLAFVGGNDDANGSLQSEFEFDAVAGTTYRIQVDGFSGDWDTFQLSYGVNRPANDDFDNAEVLPGSTGTVFGSNARSTGQAGEPNLGTLPDSTVWYSWVAPADGTAVFTTNGSDFDTVLAAATGSSVTGLSLVTTNDQYNGTNQSLITFPVTNGTTYRILVDGYDNARGAIALQYSLNPPANDSFWTPEALTGTIGSTFGSNVAATAEPGEPEVSYPDSSLWYTWTAPADGSALFTTNGSDFDTVMAAYTGGSITGLTMVGTNDDVNGTLQSLMTFAVTTGTTYRIVVDGFSSGSRGNMGLQFSLNPPANNLFGSPEILIGAEGVTFGSTAQATGEPGEPSLTLGNTPDASVWYSWTAPADGTARFSTRGSTFISDMAVVTGFFITGLTTVTSNFEFNGTSQSLVSFPAVAGTEYRIWIDGFGTRGDVMLQWSLGPPANDMFAAAEVISGNGGAVAGTTAFAVAEPGEPDHFNAVDSSVWYSWTAPKTGTVAFQAAEGAVDHVMAAYMGAAITGLTLVASDDDSGPGVEPLVNFPAVIGTTYLIVVDPYAYDFGGAFTLRWNFSICSSLPATITGSGPIVGTAGDDVIVGSNSVDTIDGGTGNDTICGLAGGDVLNGEAGFDTIFGGKGADVLDGGSDNDVLRGDGNDDVITDGSGSDDVQGGSGNDVMLQGSVADAGDLIDGGTGRDKVIYSRTAGVTITLNDSLPNDGEAFETDLILAIENVTTGSGPDTITGSNLSNKLDGLGGIDVIDGRGGDDALDGGPQNDDLTGANGADTVNGFNGDDFIDVSDGTGGNDTANGGGGTDTVSFDPGDTLIGIP